MFLLVDARIRIRSNNYGYTDPDPKHWFFVWTLAYEDDRDEQGFPAEPDGEGQAVHHQVQLERCQEEEPEMLEHLRKKIPTRELSISYA